MTIEMITPEIIASHYADVMQMVRPYVKSPIDVDDISQVVIIKAIENISQFNGDYSAQHPKKFLGWLKVISRNTVNDFYRDRYRKTEETLPTFAEGIDECCDSNTPITIAIHNENLEALSTALEALSECHRTIVHRFYFNGEPLTAIALDLDVPHGTVKRWASEARSNLLDQLTE